MSQTKLTSSFLIQPVAPLQHSLRDSGWALQTLSVTQAETNFVKFQASWQNLELDRYLKDRGQYRQRRHASFIQTLDKQQHTLGLHHQPYRPHWQPTHYNALHGGIKRWFAEIETTFLVGTNPLGMLIQEIGELLATVKPTEQWFVEAHQFRIDASQEIGKPTPEGAHRDGVDFVALLLVERHNVSGGETSIYNQKRELATRTTLARPWTLMLLDDTRVIHETTPIQAVQPGCTAYRDTLVLTYRHAGFQEPI